MKCRGAVLSGAGKSWEVRQIDLDPPRAGEVLVRMAVAGICHSDDHYATGDGVAGQRLTAIMETNGIPVPDLYPMLGGHEGAGVVAEVGPGVRSVQPGDRVATSFIPACGSCRWCSSGLSYLCDLGASTLSKEMTTDGTPRRHLGDAALTAMTQLGTFAEYVVAAESSVIKIDDDIPFHAGSLVSCGVTTGWGSATVGAGTEVGDTVVVIGVGGVGMNALQGARAVGAKYVVAVDPFAFKRDSVTFRRHPCRGVGRGGAPLVRNLTRGVMADRVVLTPGVVPTDLLSPAMMLTRKGGACVLTRLSRYEEVPVPLVLNDMVLSAKQLKGVLGGGMNPRACTPMLLSMYRGGRL
jgi:NDMA-dependent alcohol dehydrogenase